MAGRNCAKRCVFPKFRGFAASKSQLLKASGRGRSAVEDADKICTTPARERNSK